LIDYDPFSPRWRADPYAAYRMLRKDAPVHRAPESGMFCVSRYEDVAFALKRPELFSSRAMFTVLMNGGSDGELPITLASLRMIARFLWRARVNPFAFQRARNLISEDPPVHETLRGRAGSRPGRRASTSWWPSGWRPCAGARSSTSCTSSPCRCR
jgi:cytochrome P450